MNDLLSYRASIGLFYYVYVATRSLRSVKKQLKQARRRRNYFTLPWPFILLVAAIFSTCLLMCYANNSSTSQPVVISLSSCGTMQFDEEKQFWPLVQFVHFMNTNRGAHAYNGNPRIPGIKKRLDPNQQTLKSLMRQTNRLADHDVAAFSDDSLDCFPPSPDVCTSAPPTPVLASKQLEPPVDIDESSTHSTDPPPVLHAVDDENSVNVGCNPSTPNSKVYDRHKQGFLKSWFDKQPSLKEWCTQSSKGVNYAFCSVCNKDLKIEGGGIKDLLKHPKSVKHIKLLNEQKTTKPLQNHFEPSAISEQVATAEILWCTFLTEHQLSFRLSDHACKLFAKMFPDSKIAAKFKCSRTKSRNIVCNVVAPKMEENVTNILQKSFFSVLTDDTTDVTTKSQCCVLVRYFDNLTGTVKGAFYKIVHLKSATGEAVFKAITNAFEKSRVPFKNIIALGTDGAATMIGKTKGLFGRFKQIQENVFSVWCICHQVHIAAKKASNVFPKDVHDLPVELFYWFKKSYKRCSTFKDMQTFCNVINHKLLKPSDTRWLATQEIAERLCEQWQPLKSYFNSLATDYEIDECGKKRKVDKLTREKILKIRKILNCELNHLCFLFVKDSLKKFTKFNKFFQTTRPVAYLMNEKMNMLLKDLLSCFIKPEVINNAKFDLTKIDETCDSNLCEKDDMWVGDVSTFNLLTELEDNGKQVVVDQFFDFVRQFYVHSVREIKKLPFQNEIIMNLKALNPLLQGTASVRKMFMYLAKQFPNIVAVNELGPLDSELRNYDTFDLPGLFSDDFVVIDGKRVSLSKGVDNYWWKIGKICENGVQTFPILSKLAKALLCIPHGNAESEQLFSRLKLIKTKFKSHMNTTTLNSSLTINFNLNCDCYEFKPTKAMINKVRLGLSDVDLQRNKNDMANNCDMCTSEPSYNSNVCAQVSPSKPRIKRARKNNSKYDDFIDI